MNVSTEWFAGMTEEQKEKFSLVLKNNSLVFARLREILSQWENQIQKTENSLDDFKDPNWSHKEAFRHGDKSRISKMKDLINTL